MNAKTRWIPLMITALAAASAGAQQPPLAVPPATQEASATSHPLRHVRPSEGFAYFSGHFKNNHNHPAIYAFQADTQKLLVIGRGYRMEFPISESEQAFKAYRALLKRSNYKVDRRDDGGSPPVPAK